jgi:hypothetical protein
LQQREEQAAGTAADLKGRAGMLAEQLVDQREFGGFAFFGPKGVVQQGFE